MVPKDDPVKLPAAPLQADEVEKKVSANCDELSTGAAAEYVNLYDPVPLLELAQPEDIVLVL
jgi:hypothetical protein